MLIKEHELTPYLRKSGLASVMLVSGDDSLQQLEAADQVRKQAKKSAYEREILTVDPQFKWQMLIDAADHYDLFSSRKLIELHHPSGKFDKSALDALQYFFDKEPEDKRLLIITGKLTGSQKKAKWCQLIQKKGLAVFLWPPSRLALPKWIETRLKKLNLSADRYATALLAQYSEGNLSTAQQAIDKLALLQPSLPVGVEVMQQVISDHANFSPFDCVDAALAASPKRATRLLKGLHATNQEITLVLWAFSQQIKLLYGIREKINAGQKLAQALQGQWERRIPLLQSAIQRLSLNKLAQCLENAFQIDLIIKGVKPGDPWDAIQTLCLSLSGVKGVSQFN